MNNFPLKKHFHYSTRFRKSYKKVKKSVKWRKHVFNHKLPKYELTTWAFILNCLCSGIKIPSQFHPHYLKGVNTTVKKNLKNRLRYYNSSLNHVSIKISVSELHFNNPHDSYLLVYLVGKYNVYLIDIGGHDILKRLN